MNLGQAKLAAFGATRKKDSRCDGDKNLLTLLSANTIVTMVGKSWDYHVTHVLDATLEENLAMIGESMAWMRPRVAK